MNFLNPKQWVHKMPSTDAKHVCFTPAAYAHLAWLSICLESATEPTAMASWIAFTSAAAAITTLDVSRRLSHLSPRRKASLCDSAAGSTACGRKHIRVMSQNVWNSFFAGGPGRGARLVAFKEQLERLSVDILIVQEMFVLGFGPFADSSETDEAHRLLLQLGFVHQTSPKASLPWIGQSSGLVVYSKYPITQEHHGTFAHRRSVTAKGWLEVVVDVGRSAQDEVQHLRKRGF